MPYLITLVAGDTSVLSRWTWVESPSTLTVCMETTTSEADPCRPTSSRLGSLENTERKPAWAGADGTNKGLVPARSAFPHSMSYRLVVILARGVVVADSEDKSRILDSLVEHTVPGRLRDARPPSNKELDATRIVALPIEEASAKIRSAGRGEIRRRLARLGRCDPVVADGRRSVARSKDERRHRRTTVRRGLRTTESC